MSSWNKHVKKRTIQQDTSAVICAIALDEEYYIDEWIHYHLLLGFSHIYIYDNSDANTLQGKQNEQVTIIHFPGKTKQMEAYATFGRQYKNKHTWAAFLDIDEFIVLKVDMNVSSFLKKYEVHSAVGLNWIMFGTSHETVYRNEPVTKRFQRCSSTMDSHIKSIVQLQYLDTENGMTPHYFTMIKGNTVDTSKQSIISSFHPNGSTQIACIHHYYSKSEEEFLKKIKRGRADIVDKRSLTELDGIHTKNNEVVNTDAWDFYSKHGA
jgi:hypothetical protein